MRFEIMINSSKLNARPLSKPGKSVRIMVPFLDGEEFTGFEDVLFREGGAVSQVDHN